MIGSMAIPCTQCGYENREHYRFCGKCGALLTAARTEATPRLATERLTPARPAPPAAERTTYSGYTANPPAAYVPNAAASDRDVSGPSFLGLSEPAPGTGVEYLLEDEEPDHGGRRRMLVALLLLAVAGTLVMWRWRGGDFSWVKRFVAPQTDSTPPVQSNPSFTNGPPVGQGASSPPTPSMPMASSGTEGPTSSTPPPPPSAESHMVKPDESAPQTQTPRAEKKPAAKQSAPTEQAANDQPADKAPDESASNDDAESGDNNVPAEATKKTAEAAPPADRKMPQAEAPAPTNSADEALVAQGEKYLYGDGAPENCGLAQKSLQTAASHSNARALSMLGTMYATGHCSNRDLPTAYKYFARALHQDPGNGRIQRDLEVLWRQMNASERQAATRN